MPLAASDAQQRFAIGKPGAPFADRLDDLGRDGRLAAFEARELDAADLAAWIVSYPEEVPTINGEYIWIAATLE